MIACCLFCTIVLLSLEFYINRDLSSPSFLMGTIWTLAYILLLCLAPNSFDYNNLYFASFAVCYATFFFGMNFFQGRKKDSLVCVSDLYQWNPALKYFVFIIEYIFAIIVFTKSMQLMATSSLSAWRTLHGAMGEEDVFSTGYFGVMLNAVPVIFFISLALYLINPCFSTRKDLLISFPPVVLTMLFTSRGNWFFFVITVIYIVIYLKKISNKKMAVLGTLSFVFIIGLWIVSSLDKFELAYGYMSESEKIEYLFGSYFINPMLNFVQWFDNGIYSGGSHTFRFFCAVLNSLGFHFDVVPTVQPFLYINGTLSNVYTAINWYAQDFGIFWAFVVFFLLGCVYGKLYRTVKNPMIVDLKAVIILSMLMMPIANQFFDEKIFSIFSIWMQRFICVFLLTSPVFFDRKN